MSNTPAAKPNKGMRFYNAGDRFSEPILYSLEGIGDIHAVAKWPIDAEEKSFFNVPTELKLAVDGSRIPVDFPTTVLLRFKDRGVIMIDDEWEPSGDEEQDDLIPLARDEAEAKEKGQRRWRKYLETIVRNHIEQCQRARSMGGVPVEAYGFTKRAFKLLNIQDPATRVFDELAGEKTNSSSEVESLRGQLLETNQKFDKVMELLRQQAGLKTDDAIESAVAKKQQKKK